MNDIAKLVRPNILKLSPYSTARDEAGGAEGIRVWLDANESPYGEDGINRYPDPMQKRLKEKIAEIENIHAESIFVGNGSDEAIDLMYRIFCTPGEDNAVAIAPTYGMYGVCADINDIEYRPVQLNSDFSLPVERLLAATDGHTKLLWVCSPNNPTGNALPFEQLCELADRFRGILVVDEAYSEFNTASRKGKDLLKGRENVVVLHTLSKAYGLAGARVGLAFSTPFIVSLMNKVKYPYNVNLLSQTKALETLDSVDKIRDNIRSILAERERIGNILPLIDAIEEVYPTDANFILVKVREGRADDLYAHLKDFHIIVRNRSKTPGCAGTLRITVGTAEENDTLLEAIRNFK